MVRSYISILYHKLYHKKCLSGNSFFMKKNLPLL